MKIAATCALEQSQAQTYNLRLFRSVSFLTKVRVPICYGKQNAP